MNDDLQGSDLGTEASAEATIQLWRAPNRIWPVFPTLVLARAISRLVRRSRRVRPLIGEGGVIGVFLDGSKVGTISPNQTEVYQVSPGEHTLTLHFLGGLRRSRGLNIPLAKGEVKHFACLLNSIAWPSIRAATPEDVAAMERWQSHSRAVGYAGNEIDETKRERAQGGDDE